MAPPFSGRDDPRPYWGSIADLGTGESQEDPRDLDKVSNIPSVDTRPAERQAARAHVCTSTSEDQREQLGSARLELRRGARRTGTGAVFRLGNDFSAASIHVLANICAEGFKYH